MNNIEELTRDLLRASVELKKKLYRRDEAASTSPEEVDGPRIEVHTCRLCNRSAAVEEGAQVRHQSGCALARLQKAQRALREVWPELFFGKGTGSEREGSGGAKCAHAPENRNKRPGAGRDKTLAMEKVNVGRHRRNFLVCAHPQDRRD